MSARGALGHRAADAVTAGHTTVVAGFRTDAVESTGDGVVVVAEYGRRVGPVHEPVAVTRFRPDLSWLSEVRLDLDSCGTVHPHGAAELAQPEPGVFLVGRKSYGRAPTFLALTGYEQVRSVVTAIAGDRAAAQRVELVMPETGVCGGAGLLDITAAAADARGCCGADSGRVPVAIGGAAR